jgi:2-iminobutanoate/2-iminopropanoate deaminase
MWRARPEARECALTATTEEERLGKRQTVEVPGVTHGAPIPMGARIGNLLFSSGVMGKDPASDSLPDDPARQAELMFQNVRALLERAGGSLDDVARVTVYLKDNAYREHLNREWLKAFPDEHDRPARHTLLWDLPGGMLIQCELVAVLD